MFPTPFKQASTSTEVYLIVFENTASLLVKETGKNAKITLQSCKPKFASAWKLSKNNVAYNQAICSTDNLLSQRQN
jgi:hypothetical protein